MVKNKLEPAPKKLWEGVKVRLLNLTLPPSEEEKIKSHCFFPEAGTFNRELFYGRV